MAEIGQNISKLISGRILAWQDRCKLNGEFQRHKTTFVYVKVVEKSSSGYCRQLAKIKTTKLRIKTTEVKNKTA